MDKPKRVLRLFRREQSSGGAEIAALRLARQFESLNFEVIRVKAGDQIEGRQIKGNRGPGWVRLIQYAKTANKVIAQNPNDLSFSLERGVKADVYRAGEGVHLAWLKRKGLIKSILSFRPLHPVAIFMEAATLKAAKCIVANSEMIADEIRHHYPRYAEKVRVIENGFDPSRFFLTEAPGSNPATTGSRRLIFAGNGWERKGLDQAMKLLNLLPADWRLEVLGKGDQTKFETLTRSLEIIDQVNFRGPVANIEEYYRNCAALILPTAYDPFSNACLEAAACGCPVITTDQNGFSALINHRQTGFILGKDTLTDCADWCRENFPLDREQVSQSVANFTIGEETRRYGQVFEILGEKNG